MQKSVRPCYSIHFKAEKSEAQKSNLLKDQSCGATHHACCELVPQGVIPWEHIPTKSLERSEAQRERGALAQGHTASVGSHPPPNSGPGALCLSRCWQEWAQSWVWSGTSPSPGLPSCLSTACPWGLGAPGSPCFPDLPLLHRQTMNKKIKEGRNDDLGHVATWPGCCVTLGKAQPFSELQSPHVSTHVLSRPLPDQNPTITHVCALSLSIY